MINIFMHIRNTKREIVDQWPIISPECSIMPCTVVFIGIESELQYDPLQVQQDR
jgi:hypothetical protein